MSKEETALEVRLDYQETMSSREKIEDLLGQALVLVKEAQSLADKVGADFGTFSYYRQGYCLFNKQSPIPAVMKYFDACAWDRFFEASGIGQFMSEKARQKWKEAIAEQKVEQLTPENIKATFEALMNQSSEFLVDGVVAIARLIAWDRVSNTPTMITPKVILKSFCDSNRRIRYGSPGELDDLDRCLRTIEGKEDPPARTSTWHYWLNSVRYEEKYQGVYFDIRICASVGTCHIKFNDRGIALLPELNRLLATRYPSVLPPVRTTKKRS